MICYVGGAFVPIERALVPITDRGFWCGDGAYATLQVREGVPLLLERHLHRLQRQCASFGLAIPPFDPALITTLIAHNRAFEGIWRLKIIVTGGDDPAYALPAGRVGRLVMLLQPHTVVPYAPLRMGVFSKPFHLCHAPFKSLAHLNRFYVMQEAKSQGFDDAVTCTEGGMVLEAAFGNLFWVSNGHVYTPAPHLPLYFGVTLECMLEAARAEGLPVDYVACSLDALPQGAALFRTNTMGGVRPITCIGARHFPLCPEQERYWLGLYQQTLLIELR